jgi:hypothetical protein
MTVGGLLGLLGGGGAGGFGDKAGVVGGCVEFGDVFDGESPEGDVELLLEFAGGGLAEVELDGVLAPCTVDEPPVVEPELVVDVCAKARAKGEKINTRRMMTETV